VVALGRGQLPEIVKVVDANGTLRYASPAFGRILGYDPWEAIGTMYALELTGYPPEDLLVGGKVKLGGLIVEEDRGRVWDEVQETLDGGRGFELRYAIRRRDGRIRHVHEHGRGVCG